MKTHGFLGKVGVKPLPPCTSSPLMGAATVGLAHATGFGAADDGGGSDWQLVGLSGAALAVTVVAFWAALKNAGRAGG
jgi:hypothetical protein